MRDGTFISRQIDGARLATMLATGLSLTVALWLLWNRSLNFDEWLSLRVGWLLTSDYDNGFHFAMPLFAVTGFVANAFDDPGVVVRLLRVGVLLAMVAAIKALASTVLDGPRASLLLGLLLAANGGFLTHGFEIRYDCAILVGYVLCLVAAWDRDRVRPVLMGLGLAVLATHHLKGLFLAGGVFLVYAFERMLPRHIARWRRVLLQPLGIALLAVSLWVATAMLFGFWDEVWKFYWQFPKHVSSTRIHRDIQQLLGRIASDAAWWWVFGSLAGFGFITGFRSNLRILLYGLVPLAFTLAHPTPFPYSVIYHVPFVALMAMNGLRGLQRLLERFGSREPAALEIGLIAVTTAILFTTSRPLLVSDMTAELDVLRFARKVISSTDAVIDPVGYLYFARPADPEWYGASLLRPAVIEGRWQRGARAGAESARFAVESYRARWLPLDAIRVLRSDYQYLCGPLMFAPRGRPLQSDARCPTHPFPLNNVW
jgi:hypothetical protein